MLHPCFEVRTIKAYRSVTSGIVFVKELTLSLSSFHCHNLIILLHENFNNQQSRNDKAVISRNSTESFYIHPARKDKCKITNNTKRPQYIATGVRAFVIKIKKV